MTLPERQVQWNQFARYVGNIKWLKKRMMKIAYKTEAFVNLEGNVEIWRNIKIFVDNPFPYNNNFAIVVIDAIALLEL